MSSQIGIWIDHRKAYVVELVPDGERCTLILSHVEKHLERGGDRPMQGAYEAHQVPADDSRQRAMSGELKTYFDAVIKLLDRSDSVYIFGPGEAKGEFHKRILKCQPGAKVMAVETADKITDPQIVAKVRAFFGLSAPRTQPSKH